MGREIVGNQMVLVANEDKLILVLLLRLITTVVVVFGNIVDRQDACSHRAVSWHLW